MAGEVFGADQWFVWDVTTGVAWKPLGIVTGGDGATIENQERTRGGAGGLSTQIKTEGNIDYPGDITAILTPAGAPILTHLIDTPAALALGGDVGFGVEVHDPARPTSVSVSLGVDQPLTLNFSWLGKHRAAALPGAEVALVNQWHWEDFTGTVDIDGDCLGIQSVTFNYTYATQYSDDVCGRAVGSKREHRDLCYVGITDVTVDVELIDPPAVDDRADVMASNIVVTAEVTNNAVAPTTVTIEQTGMRWTGKASRSYQSRDSMVTWSRTLSYRFLSDAVASVTIA